MTACESSSNEVSSSSSGQVLAAQRGIQTLNGGDHDAAGSLHRAAGQKLDVVDLGEQLAGARRGEALEFVLGLRAEVLAIHQEQDAPRIGIREQTHDLVARGEGLAGTGCHLHQGARITAFQRCIEGDDRLGLAVAQSGGIDRRQ
jgi:hypothetical protein